jgi:hypothetical protein
MSSQGVVIFVSTDSDNDLIVSPAVCLLAFNDADGVYGLLREMDRRRIRCDANASAARFAQIAGEAVDYYGGCTGLSVYLFNGPSRITPAALSKLPVSPDHGFFVVTRSPISAPFVRRFIEGPVGKWHEMPSKFVDKERNAAFDSGYPGIMEDRFTQQFPRLSQAV